MATPTDILNILTGTTDPATVASQQNKAFIEAGKQRVAEF